MAPSDLKSKLSIAAKAVVAEGTTIYATQILTAVPKAIWEQRTLDSNGIPAGVDPMNGTTIENALTGYTLTPQTPKAQVSLQIPIEYLQFTTYGPQIPVHWSAPILPLTDTFSGQTVHDTIGDQLATPNRATLIDAINKAGFSVNPQVDVSSLVDAAAGALLGAPELRYLGEAR